MWCEPSPEVEQVQVEEVQVGAAPTTPPASTHLPVKALSVPDSRDTERWKGVSLAAAAARWASVIGVMS